MVVLEGGAFSYERGTPVTLERGGGGVVVGAAALQGNLAHKKRF